MEKRCGLVMSCRLFFFFGLVFMILLGMTCALADSTLQSGQPSSGINLLGVTVSAADTSLDLSGQSIPDIEELKAALVKLPGLRKINLGNCSLTAAQMKDLLDSFPGVEFNWSFTMYDIPVNSTDTKIDLGKKKITKLDEFMGYLDCLPNLTQVDMFESRLKEKQVWTLYERYPDIKFGWTLTVCGFRVRTDDLTFSMHRRGEPLYKSKDFQLLTLCPNLLALDLGHNVITDLTFLESLPKLKILILADNHITDISSLAKLKDLQYLELFMNKITDVTPLADLTQLLDLNLCFNDITDATPLIANTKLERLWISRNELNDEQKDILLKALPGCTIDFTAKMATWDGWRTHDRFYAMRNILNTGIYEGWTW